MMDPIDYDYDEEAIDLHKRSYRAPMLLLASAAAIVTVMAVSPGTRHRVLWHVGLAAAPEAGEAGLAPLASPVYGFTTVEVLLSKEADLLVDGKPVGNARRQSLQLAPGQHVLVAQQGSRVLTEKFTAPPNESLRVEFQTNNVRVFREVTATP